MVTLFSHNLPLKMCVCICEIEPTIISIIKHAKIQMSLMLINRNSNKKLVKNNGYNLGRLPLVHIILGHYKDNFHVNG